MKKILVTAATVGMSAALAGLAFAAAPDGSPTTGTSVVSPAPTPEVTPPATPEVTPSATPEVTPSATPDAPDDSDGRDGGGHGSDD